LAVLAATAILCLDSHPTGPYGAGMMRLQPGMGSRFVGRAPLSGQPRFARQFVFPPLLSVCDKVTLAQHHWWAAAVRKASLMVLVTLWAALIVRPCLAGSVVEPDAIGEWSQPTNNIRGRLLFVELAQSKEGPRTGLVFLEFQNLSWSEPAYVYYDALKAPPSCKLRDSAGKIVEQTRSGSDAAPIPCWLTLPAHSTMRFLASYGPNSRPNRPSLTFSVGMDQTWIIPLSTTNRYFLSGTYTNATPRNEGRERGWKGTLNLPPVRIPVKAR
jgi:hypothetical protein